MCTGLKILFFDFKTHIHTQDFLILCTVYVRYNNGLWLELRIRAHSNRRFLLFSKISKNRIVWKFLGRVMDLVWSDFWSKMAIFRQFRRQIGQNLTFRGVWKLKVFVVTSSFQKTIFSKNEVGWKVHFLTILTIFWDSQKRLWEGYTGLRMTFSSV